MVLSSRRLAYHCSACPRTESGEADRIFDIEPHSRYGNSFLILLLPLPEGKPDIPDFMESYTVQYRVTVELCLDSGAII